MAVLVDDRETKTLSSHTHNHRYGKGLDVLTKRGDERWKIFVAHARQTRHDFVSQRVDEEVRSRDKIHDKVAEESSFLEIEEKAHDLTRLVNVSP